MGSVLLQTPSETLIHILSYLDWRQLVSAQRISRLFQELIRSSVELQYIIELGADDLVDNVDQDKCGLVTTQDRLTLLLDRRRRWRTLDWTYKASISLPYEYGDFKLIGGVFVGQVDNVTASSALLAIWPHTKSDLCADGTEQQQRAVGGDMPFWTKESAIDPTQDLLALLTRDVSLGIIVHLSTLSLRETHPLATISPLIFPTILSVTPQMGVSMSPLQIIGDIISVNFFWGERYTGHHYLHIFNWHTGALLVNLETDLSHRPTFLSPRAYMIASIYDSGSLDLYEIHDSTTSSDTVEPPTRVLRLRLPKVLPNRRLDLTTVQSSSYLADPEALHSPFIQRQGRGIHLVTLFYTSQLVFALHVKNETLLGMMAQVRKGEGVANHLQHILVPTACAHFATSGAPDAPPIDMHENVLAWKWWGPQYTRFLRQGLRNESTNGYRVAFSRAYTQAFPRGSMHIDLCIFDFNVHPNRKDDPCNLEFDDGDGENRQWKYEVHTEETVLPGLDTFEEPVVSSLPYAAVSRPIYVSGYRRFLFDEQSLVIVKQSGTPDRKVDIDVFKM